MIKKILFILSLSIASFGFSQKKSIDNLSTAPNPFQNSTKISFFSVKKDNVTLIVKNILGKMVYKKKHSVKKGNNSILFFKENLRKGMYIYSIQNEKKIISKRFVIK